MDELGTLTYGLIGRSNSFKLSTSCGGIYAPYLPKTVLVRGCFEIHYKIHIFVAFQISLPL